MVFSNMGLPEPPENEDSLTTNNDLIVAVESDSEEDDNMYNGYERLPLRPEEVVSAEDDEESDENDEAAAVPSIVSMESELVQEVWSTQANSKDILMDSEKVNQVKQAMSNFHLPATNIPEWAHNLSEEQWNEHISTFLNKK